MKSVESPIDGFTKWLPGEMVYSAKKAGYDKKIGRAQMDPSDRLSMHGHLSEEWFAYRFASSQGAHYMPFHGKSGQLQLAKLSAGLFDKAALGMWMAEGSAPTESNFARIAHETAEEIVGRAPWNDSEVDPAMLLVDFEDTPFAPGIKMIMAGISSAVDVSGEMQIEAIAEFSEHAIRLGGLAASAYELYALGNLTQEQYVLPASQLATKHSQSH